jgi:regulator of replication initiation timing
VKLKTDDSGAVVLDDGKPVYVDDNGNDVAVDVPDLFGKIKQLNNENGKRRLEAKELKEKLDAFGDLDAAEAAKALETVANLKDKQLIDAGEAEKVKKAAIEGYEAKLADTKKAISERDATIRDLTIGTAFATSEYVKGLTMPPDLAQRAFGDRFSYEDGKVIGKQPDGTPIMSRENPADPASFDEAMKAIVTSRPDKDDLLRGGNPGSGAPGGSNGPSGTGRKLSAMSTSEKLAFIKQNGSEAYAKARFRESQAQNTQE